MFLRLGYDFQFDLTAPTHMLLMLHAHPEQAHVLQRPEAIRTEPELRVETSLDSFGNRAARLHAPAGKLRITYDNVAWDSGLHEPTIQGQRLHTIEELPSDVLPFLLG